MKIQLSYKQKLFLYFAIIFVAFSVAVIVIEQSRDKKFRTEHLEDQLDTYAEIIHLSLRKNAANQTLDSLIQLFPQNLRVSLIDKNGVVKFDNLIQNVNDLDNHSNRAEICKALNDGRGSDRRVSTSDQREYLYFARKFDENFIRVALPYDLHVQQSLKTDKFFLYVIILLFAVILLIISILSERLNNESQRKIDRLKQEMTGNIAHELRTPVTGIRGYLETILEQPQLDNEKKTHFLNQAYQQTIVLSELIQDVSLITKMEEAPKSFRMEDVNIPNLLQTLKNDLALSLQKKHIEMKWQMPENLSIKGNPNLLYAIFRNLSDNAIRYAGENIEIQIKMYAEDPDFYYFSFYDTGVGIADERHLQRLFERFYRIDEGRTRDTGNSGLGLSIVKNAIAFHKGTITVENRTGGGLEFLFRLKK